METYKVGDKVEILEDKEFFFSPRIYYKKGEIHTIAGIDEDGFPWNERGITHVGWLNYGKWFRKVTTENTDPIPDTITINGKLYNLVPVDN